MDQENLKRLQSGIDDYVKKQVEWIERDRADIPDAPAILPLIQMSIGRVLMKFARRYESVTMSVMEASMDDTRHIYDWLLAASLRGEDWLTRCDDNGRPLKLMKFGTIQQIVNEANKAMAKRRGGGFRVPAGEGAKVVHEYGDGWTVVRLTTPEALDREGDIMGHCVGQGAYDRGLSTNFMGIYSLRDSFGKSHVTIEIDNAMEIVKQIKGKQNKPPKAEYMRRLLGWHKLKEVRVEGTELPRGFVAERTRGIVELSALQPGDVFEGNIGVVLESNDDYILDVPAGVTIRGDVVIHGYKSGKLVEVGNVVQVRWAKVAIPHGVFIEGDVRLDSVTLDGLSLAGGRLVIRNATVQKLDDIRCDVTQFAAVNFTDGALNGACFKGSVEMQACRGVVFQASTTIGAHLSVAGCKAIPGQQVPLAFADGFQVRRELYIYNSTVSFGDTCHVEGNVDINGSTVDHMPSSLSVTGNLIIDDCQIDRWPEALDITGTFTETDVVTARSRPGQDVRNSLRNP